MSDPLDRVVEALRTAPVPPGPSAEVMAATVAAVTDRAKPLHAERRRRVMRIVGYGTAGTLAAGVLVAAGVLWVGAGSVTALEEALKKAERATSYRVVFTDRRGDATTEIATLHIQGTSFRLDKSNGAVVLQEITPNGVTTLTLDPLNSTARLVKFPGANPDAALAFVTDPLADFRNEKDWVVREADKEAIDGRAMRVYEITPVKPAPNRHPCKLWVDAASGLPVRMSETKGEQVERVRTYHAWNEKFDPKMFEMIVPEGYTLIEVDPDGTPKRKKGEQFVVLRRAADNAEKADSCRMETRTEAGGKVVRSWTIVRSGTRVRSESGHGTITVTDHATHMSLRLDAKTKQAQLGVSAPHKPHKIVTLEAAVLSGRLAAIVAEVGEGAEDTVRVLGPENINGRPTTAYQFTSPNGGFMPGRVWTVWIDPKTELPVRMRFSDPGDPEVNTLEFVAWGEKMDEALFRFDVPDGYKRVEPEPKK